MLSVCRLLVQPKNCSAKKRVASTAFPKNYKKKNKKKTTQKQSINEKSKKTLTFDIVRHSVLWETFYWISLLIDQSINWQIILALFSCLLFCSSLFSVQFPWKQSTVLPQKSCKNNSQQCLVSTPNQSLHPNHICALPTSLSQKTNCIPGSGQQWSLLNTYTQVYKSPQRRLYVSLAARAGGGGWGVCVGGGDGAVARSEHVQADLNGCWYSDFPQELLSGLCRCFRFQREAINAQPVDLIHMYGWLLRSVQPLPLYLLPDCLKALPAGAQIGSSHHKDRNWIADMVGTKDKQGWFHKVIIQTMHLDV